MQNNVKSRVASLSMAGISWFGLANEHTISLSLVAHKMVLELLLNALLPPVSLAVTFSTAGARVGFVFRSIVSSSFCCGGKDLQRGIYTELRTRHTLGAHINIAVRMSVLELLENTENKCTVSSV